MASTQELLALQLYRCYHCGLESTTDSFRYLNNKKVDQPRCQCQHCHKFFTLGSHGRPQGRNYAKKRNEDPIELKSLSRQCRHCGVADNAPFKYYNNHNLSQPRFKCLSCGKQFQMRLLETGGEKRLVHTSSQQRSIPRRRKQGMSEPLPSASSSSEDGRYQPFDGSCMSVPSDPMMHPTMSDEDEQYSNFLEAELAEEENPNTKFISWTGNGDNGNLPLPQNIEDAQYSSCLEAELLAMENNLNVDAFSSTTNVDDALPLPWSSEDLDYAELTDLIEASVTDNEAPNADIVSDNTDDMISEYTSNNAEVMYGTCEVDRPATSDSDSCSQNDTSMDPSTMNYEDAAIACFRQMDMDMARKNSMLSVAPVQSTGAPSLSSAVSSAGSTIMFPHPFCVIPKPQLDQQAWNEDDDETEDDIEMTPWAYLLAS